MTDAKPKRRLRFSLRTLLALVALAAIGSWSYWVARPWWLDYRERIAMEKSIKQFRPGMPLIEFHRLVSNGYLRLVRVTGFSDGLNGHQVFDFDIGRAIYIACIEVQPDPKGSSEICRRLEFYRLPFPPNDYRARTKHGAAVEASEVTPSTSATERSRMLYMADFREFIAGDRANNPGFKYQLIYSDAAANSMR
jgi:hypothetical protein